jgi:uncharacterized membrane protein YphA (DoxX/SURF4 family)
MNETAAARPWTLPRRVLFRFAALYFGLYAFPFPLGYLPGTDTVGDVLSDLWNPLVLWTGAHILSLPEPIVIQPTGSGDTLFAHVQLLLVFAFAVVGCGVWTLLERGRSQHPTLAGWLRIACRYYLGFILVSYGSYKVIPTQFPFPHLIRLTTPYGESSPMGLLWTFMGYSAPYNLFTGGMEVLGGLLLLFRRTTTLGALVSVGVMSNVVMLNFCYDVPVKLFSTHLLVFAGILAARDCRRLLHLFVLNRPVAPADLSPPWSARWDAGRRRGLRWTVKALLIGAVLVGAFHTSWGVYQTYGAGREEPPLYGLYDVETFVKDGIEHPPLLTDAERWRTVIFDWPERVAVRRMDGSVVWLTVAVDEAAGTLQITPRGPAQTPTPWTFERPQPGRLILTGEMEGSTYSVETTARDLDTFLLRSRGFHWVQELPFNR